MKSYPCAKINLGLNVTGRRADGYHDLETVFYPVGVCDEIEMSVIGDGSPARIELTTESLAGGPWGALCGDAGDNLVVRAYNMLASRYRLPAVRVVLRKGIPVQAGMGGGSADGAYMLRMLNDMACLGLDDDALRGYASSLGADCAFFVCPRPSYAEGIGDRLSPVDVDLSDYKIAIVKPPVAVSTREAFAGVRVGRPRLSCRDIVTRSVERWRDVLHNDFEDTVFAVRPLLGDIKSRLYDMGAVYASMSGSGSALYGLFRSVPDMSCFDGCFTTVV